MTAQIPKPAPTIGERVQPQAQEPIVVAVDGSEKNRSAVDWATAEAVSVDCELVLVTAVEDFVTPIPHFSLHAQDIYATDVLTTAAASIQEVLTDQEVRARVVTGPPVTVILDAARGARMIVVGKRGLGGIARVMIGSTSIRVAGRAKVQTIIVPDGWKQADHAHEPIVLGIDPYDPRPDPIRYAFNRARRLGVPLVAVHGWETPSVYAWDSAAQAGSLTEWEKDAHAAFDRVLIPWRERFPDVEVTALHKHSHPAAAVLDAAENAQLVVLGRHTDGKLGGFPFGSVTRAVLHYSERPVVVSPSD